MLFLALAIAPIVVLALGPFRDRFFPRDVAALRALARVEAPRLDAAALRQLAGASFSSAGDRAWLAELAQAGGARRWDEIVQRLDALPRERITPGLMYLHGIAALLAERPAIALAGLEAASRADDPALSESASLALAQAFLMLDRGDAAPRHSVPLHSGP